ncbi:MAG: biotin/lipoyl-binding protein [Desulfobacterales bacterium]
MIKDITIPEISENVTSGTVVAVLVETGDDVKVDDTIVEFETDKAVVEIPSPFDGRITEVLVQEGDEMNVGDVIAKIDTEKDAAEEEKEEERAEAQKGGKAKTEEKAPPQEEATQKTPEKKHDAEEEERQKAEQAEPERRAEESKGEKKAREAEADEKQPPAGAQKPAPASPSVRRFARELGIDIHAVKRSAPPPIGISALPRRLHPRYAVLPGNWGSISTPSSPPARANGSASPTSRPM